MVNKKKLMGSSFTWLIIVFVGVLGFFFLISGDEKKVSSDFDLKNSLEDSTNDIKKFTSSAELTEFLRENSQSNSGVGFGSNLMIDRVNTFSALPESSVKSSSSDLGSSESGDYSKTNVQVEGVDEADFVKTDGDFIYLISQDELIIIDSSSGKDSEIVSRTEISGNPKDLFVNRDRVVVFVEDYLDVYEIDEFEFAPRQAKEAQTVALVFDVSNREKISKIKDYSITGNYFQSRMIGDYIYFISNENVYYWGRPVPFPAVRQNGVLINKPEIFYFDNPDSSYNYHSVGSFNIFEDRQKFNSKTFLLGYSSTLYMSENSIYIGYQKNYPQSYYQYQKVDMFFNVVVPLLPAQVRDDISEIEVELEQNSMKSYLEAWDKISLVLENMYNYMDEDEKEELIERIEDTVTEYEAKIEDERSRTIIHKLDINRDEVDYHARGEVAGTLLNQFSLDERDDNLRVATTSSFYVRDLGHQSYSNVFVLDDDMEVIGEVTKIAPEERIYSTRFMDDKLYMVTFKQVDPLFTIDLSEPTNPQIKGQLKVPGFSNYLHPYDENFLIGLGKDTYVDDKTGGVRTKGIKLSLFDVSDFDNPKEVDTMVIGDSGSHSEAINDHKAFLFDKEKNLLVIPVREVGEKYETDTKGYFRNKVWNGAYVFTITSNGFDVRGKVSHSEKDDENYYWSSPFNVKRSLFVDDSLYTFSPSKVLVSDLGTVEEINEIDLKYDKDWYPFRYTNSLVDEPVILR